MSDFQEIPLPCGARARVSPEDFHWLAQRSWQKDHDGYAVCSLFSGRTARVLMHRLILLAPDKALVDHANGDRLDNRRCNLRMASRSQQLHNQRSRGGLSRFKGVTRRMVGKPWQASISVAGQLRYLGTFNDEEEAAAAYDRAAREHFGEFACVNFPRPGERGAV